MSGVNMNFLSVTFGRMALLLVAILVSAPGLALAGPDRISFLLGSAHVETAREFEEVNPGVFVTWEDRWNGLDYSLGAYRNSFGGVSTAATAALPLFTAASMEVSVFAGVAIYPGDGDEFLYHAGDLVPLGGIQLRRDPVFLQIMPGGGDPDAIISFGVTIPLER